MSEDLLKGLKELMGDVPEGEQGICSDSFIVFDAVSRLCNFSLNVFDFLEFKTVYQSERNPYFDNIKDTQKLRNTNIALLDNLHEDCVDQFIEMRQAYLRTFSSMSMDKKLNHVLVGNCTISVNGKTTTIARKFTPIKLTKDGRLWLGLFCDGEIAKKCDANAMIVGEGFRYLYNDKTKIYEMDSNAINLTRVEKEILLMAKGGATTKEIACKTGRAVATIRTHIARFYKTLNVSSMTEAINVADKLKLL